MFTTGKKTAAKKPDAIGSMKALAKLVGRDVAQISRWTKRPDWPFPRNAPWSPAQVPEVMRWIADTLTSTDAAKAASGPHAEAINELRRDRLQQDCRRLRAQADRAEMELARERGTLIDADEASAEWARLGNTVRIGFEHLASQIIPLLLTQGLPHEAAPIVQEQIDEIIRGILRVISADGDATPDESNNPLQPAAPAESQP